MINGLEFDRVQCFLDPRGTGVNGRRHPGAGAAQRATGVAKGRSGPLTPETRPMLQLGFNQGVARRLIPLPCGEHGAWGRAPTSSAQSHPYKVNRTAPRAKAGHISLTHHENQFSSVTSAQPAVAAPDYAACHACADYPSALTAALCSMN